MKVLIIVAAILAVVSGQKFQFQKHKAAFVYQPDNSGRYRATSSSNDGRYTPDKSGAYNANDGRYHPDNSGAYVHTDNKYKHDDAKYMHQADKFGKDGKYTGSNNNGGLEHGHGLGQNQEPAGFATYARPSKQPIRQNSNNNNNNQFRQSGAISGSKYNNENYRILKKVENVYQDGYHYLYETENGILAEEQGKLAKVGTDKEGMKAQGFFTYTGPDNVVYTLRYTADENGFVPEGAHIPTPPPIPAAILRSLEYQRSQGKL